MGTPNCGVELGIKNRDFRPVSRFISEMIDKKPFSFQMVPFSVTLNAAY